MENSDDIQKRICIEAGKSSFEGFSGRGIAGNITEKILVKELERHFPNLKFASGLVINSEKMGKQLSKEKSGNKSIVSPQIDIIIYRDIPFKEREGFVRVLPKQVVAVIEVKKWTSPNDFKLSKTAKKKGEYNEQLETMRQSAPGIPVLFIGFMFMGKKQNLTLQNYKDGSTVKEDTFLFCKLQDKQYEIEEDMAREIEKGLCKGELQKLFETVERYERKNNAI